VAIPSVTPPYLPWSTDNAEHEGGNLIARLERIFSEDSEFHLQIYADHDRQTDATLGSLQETSNIDVDLQHRFSLPLHQSFTYGLEYRYLPTSQNDMALWTWNLNERNSQLFTGFLQDEIGLVPDHLRLTLGTKVEHNDFTGWELQPNARLSWRLAERQTVWAAVSRAVAIPSIAYNDIQIHQLPTDPVGFAAPQVPVFVGFTGNPELQAQELMGYELGYRIQISPALSFDLASFYNCYDQLVYADRQTPQFYANPAQPDANASGCFAGAQRPLVACSLAQAGQAQEDEDIAARGQAQPRPAALGEDDGAKLEDKGEEESARGQDFFGFVHRELRIPGWVGW